MKAGSIAGTLDSDGNRVIRINRRMYIAHRLAWLLVKGRWPKVQFSTETASRKTTALQTCD